MKFIYTVLFDVFIFATRIQNALEILDPDPAKLFGSCGSGSTTLIETVTYNQIMNFNALQLIVIFIIVISLLTRRTRYQNLLPKWINTSWMLDSELVSLVTRFSWIKTGSSFSSTELSSELCKLNCAKILLIVCEEMFFIDLDGYWKLIKKYVTWYIIGILRNANI